MCFLNHYFNERNSLKVREEATNRNYNLSWKNQNLEEVKPSVAISQISGLGILQFGG